MSFVAGQKVKVVDPGYFKMKRGDVVEIVDSRVDRDDGTEYVAVKQPDGVVRRGLYASRFEAVPVNSYDWKYVTSTPPAVNRFKVGQRLKVVDASHSMPALKHGEFVTYVRESTLSSDDIIVSRDNGREVSFMARRFEAVTPTVAPKAPETIYIAHADYVAKRATVAGVSLEEFNDGAEVAEYRLVRVGKVQKKTSASLA